MLIIRLGGRVIGAHDGQLVFPPYGGLVFSLKLRVPVVRNSNDIQRIQR